MLRLYLIKGSICPPTMAPTTAIVCTIVFVFQFSSGFALKVQIYRDLEFKGLIYEHNTNDEGTPCYDIKVYGRGEAGSIKTDTCLIAYENVNCGGLSYKLSRDMTNELAHFAKKISSFHACNSTHGGRQIRVDMFQGNTVVGKYKDICGCQDLPTQITTAVNRLNNYGNCITVYSTETCTGTSRNISGGQNEISENLALLGFRVRSVSGCGTRRACYLLDAKIHKFRILPDDARASTMATEKEVELATKTTFHNNGSATVTQQYEASKTVSESTTFQTSKTIKSMNSHTVEVGASVEVSGETGVGFAKVAAKVSASVKYAYNRQDSEENSQSESYTHTEQKTFAVKQTLEIPPCSQYEVQSMVSMAENYPVKYELYALVTGVSSGERMTALEVSQQVDEMTFVRLVDDYTAEFKSTHSIIANVGVDTFISGEGNYIEGCSTRRQGLSVELNEITSQ